MGKEKGVYSIKEKGLCFEEGEGAFFVQVDGFAS